MGVPSLLPRIVVAIQTQAADVATFLIFWPFTETPQPAPAVAPSPHFAVETALAKSAFEAIVTLGPVRRIGATPPGGHTMTPSASDAWAGTIDNAGTPARSAVRIRSFRIH
jgi:hypothetical protein